MITSTPTASPAVPELVEIRLDGILESADNPRKHFDETFVAQMAASMRDVGQISPVLVRPHPTKAGHYELVAGATRLRAAKVAALPSLRAVVEPMDDEKFLKAMTFENLKRRDLRPLEEARGYALLMKRIDGYTPEKIASESGVSVDYVRDRVRLLRLTDAAQQLLEKESIDLGHALELAKLNSKDQARTIKDGLFVRVAAAQQSELLKLERAPTVKPVTVHELRAWIDRHVLADLSHPDLKDLYPETHRLLQQQKTEKLAQVFIATGYVLPEVKRGVEVLTPANWRRADGQRGSKTCDRPKKIGVVAASDAARSQAFLVCTSKVCPVHFPEHVKRAAQRAKGQAAGAAKGKEAVSAAEQEKRRREIEAKEAAARKARVELIERAAPTIRKALVAALAKAKPEPLIAEMLKSCEYEMKQKDTREMLAQLPVKDLAGEVRRLWLLDQMREGLEFTSWGMEHQLPKICKRFGIDLAALLRDASPTKDLKCAHCGCTEANACKGGCAWVSTSPPVCSNPKCVKASTAKPSDVKVAAQTKPAAKKALKRAADKQFMAPVTPDAVLGAIVGTSPMPRTELTKKLWAHIKQHGLQDKKNRRIINAGTTLQELFGGKKQISMFDLTKIVGQHLTKGARA